MRQCKHRPQHYSHEQQAFSFIFIKGNKKKKKNRQPKTKTKTHCRYPAAVKQSRLANNVRGENAPVVSLAMRTTLHTCEHPMKKLPPMKPQMPIWGVIAMTRGKKPLCVIHKNIIKKHRKKIKQTTKRTNFQSRITSCLWRLQRCSVGHIYFMSHVLPFTRLDSPISRALAF